MKRLISLLLAAVIVFSAVSVGSFSVSATETAETETADGGMHTSQACIDMLKEYEGFCKYPYWDYGQYTVGFGTRCPDDMLSYYRENGITEEEAQTLLENFLLDFEEDIHYFAKKYGLTFTQNQFDALILFSYNCGSGWVYKETSEFHQAIAKGADSDELIYRFSLWCSAGGSILTALIRRRLCEANLFINGVYSTSVPEKYCYVIYNANGGSINTRAQGYHADSNVDFAPVATYEGHTFLGWYTAKTGGAQVTKLDASVNGKTLYARWDGVADTETSDGSDNTQEPETSAGITVTVQGSDVNYRKGPGTNYTILGQKDTGDKLVITETAEGNGYTWGKFDGGWIALRYTNYEEVKNAQTQEPEQSGPGETVPEETEPEETKPEETEPEETKPEETKPEETEPEETEPEETEPEETNPETVMGTVKVNEYLNIRKNPGTGYSVVGTYKPDARVEILEQKVVGGTVWGRTDKGWISLDYVALDKKDESTSTPEKDDSQTSTAVTGVVNSSDFLRIRSGPGTSYSMVGYLYAGDKVTITELKNTGSMTWGKISNGWISMNYITLTSSGSSSGSSSSTGSSSEGSSATGETGTVNVNDQLRIRSGPGTSYAVAGYLSAGEKVTITEKKTVGSTVWGKVSKGWISLDYVIMDKTGSSTGGSTENSGSSTSGSTGSTSGSTTVTGVVISSDFLRIRSGPGTSYSHVGYVYAGDKLTITEQKTVGGTVWGKITQGWVSLDYVKLDSTSDSTDSGSTQKQVKTVTAGCLNVRSDAGTGYSIVGYLYYGSKVEILETKVVNGTTWGKIATGWISMDYVK